MRRGRVDGAAAHLAQSSRNGQAPPQEALVGPLSATGFNGRVGNGMGDGDLPHEWAFGATREAGPATSTRPMPRLGRS